MDARPPRAFSDRWKRYWVHARFEEWGDLVYARPLATLILALCGHRRAVTPNGLTLASVLVRAVGLALLLGQGIALAPATAGLFLLGVALDGADGQLARARGTGSPFGAYLDKIVDLLWQAVLFLSLGWIATSSAGDPLYLLLAAVAFAAQATAFYAFWVVKADLAIRGEDLGQGIGGLDEDRPPLTWRKVWRLQIFVLFFQESDLHLWIGLGLVLDRVPELCWFLALTQVPTALFRIVARGLQSRRRTG